MAGTDTNKVTINVNGTNVEFTKIGNILGPAGKDGINGKSIYANTVDPWSVSGWNPAVAGDLFLNTTTGILWSAKAGAVTSNVQSNWTKVGELAGKITVDSALSSTSTNPVQNKVIKSALDGKAGSGHSHSSLTNSSGRVFNVPTGGSGGEQKTLVITDDLNAYQPAGNYASSTHKHPISDINDLQSTIDGIYTDMGLQDEAIAGKADENHVHPISDITGLQTALDGKAASSHTHTIGNVTGLQTALDSKQAKGNYVTTDTAQTITGDKAFSTIRTNSNIIVQDTNNDTYTYYQNKKISYIGYDSDGNIVDDYTYTLPDKSGTFATTNDIPKTGYSTNGKNYKVSADSNGNLYVYVPWTDTNTTYSTATQSANGLMSAADKKKLDGIAEGANKITIDSSLSSTSTNPIQNKVINSALNGKSNLDHNHDSVYQAKGDYATNDALKNYVTGTTFIDYTTYIEGEVNKKANASHTHEISNVSGLQSALDGKSGTGHTHTISNITNLQSTIESIYSDMGLQDEAIAGKADSVHTHTKSQITDFPTIPTVNNPTITINQGGTKKGSFTLNQSGAATINLTDNNTTYTAGTGLSLSNGAFSVKTGYTTSGKNYKVTTDSNGNLYVNVPWTDNNTTYSAGTGLSLSGTAFSVSSANVSTMMNLLSEGTSNPTDNDYYISQFVGGGTTTTTYHRRPVSKLYNYMKGKFDSIYQAKGSYAASSHTHNYLPLSGGTMTGPISYQGTKAKYTMINWIDNTGDTYGNGIRIGGGGATIIGGGESASLPSVSGGDEILYLMNDGNIDFYSNCQNGLSSAKHMTFDTSGNLNVPTDVKVNGSSVIHSGNIGSQSVKYANSAGSANSVAWGNVTGKPGTYTPSSHTHTSLKSNTDNRNSNTTPNDYNGILNIAGLKGNDKIGLDTNVYGTYSCLIGVRGWSDSSGGNAHELAFTGNGHIAHRHGSTTSWGSWNRIAHVSDIPTKLPASNISMSFSNGVLTITYK